MGVVNDIVVDVGGDGGSEEFVVMERIEMIKWFVDGSVGTWNR